MSDRTTRYGEVALECACEIVSVAPRGQRTEIINRECFGIGRLVGGGYVEESNALRELLAAAMRAGWTPREAGLKVRKAIADGKRRPKVIERREPTKPHVYPSGLSPIQRDPVAPLRDPVAPLQLVRPEPAPAPAPAPAPDKPYPPAAVLNPVWRAAMPVWQDPEAVAYFARRDIRANAIPFNEARVMKRGAPKPACLRHLTPSHRLPIPVCDHLGNLRSVRVRSLDPKAERKSLAPAGFRTRGLLFASEFARRVLKHGHPSTWPAEPEPWGGESTTFWPADLPVTFVIAEGEIDHLSWIAEIGDATEHAPAVLGVFASSWSRELAARIPDRSHLIVATDQDPAGDKYAHEIIASFAGRNVELSRWVA